MTFSENDKLKALAIVHVFETSRPFGDYAACVVLNDGAGVSYGINQFTHRSGSLAAVVEKYLDSGGQIGREIFSAVLPSLRRSSVPAIKRLAADLSFKKALRAAAVTPEMREAQGAVAFERYLRPAEQICETKGFVLPLSLAVVYDSVTHGSWYAISRTVGRSTSADPRASEKSWITEYVRKRHSWLSRIARLKVTNYRTKFFLDQIVIGNWGLGLPFAVHGVRLTDAMFPQAADRAGVLSSFSGGQLAGEEPTTTEGGFLGSAGEAVSSVAYKFDRMDNVITAVASRKDAAKSLLTTVIGTIWQAAWAVFGFFIGLPKEVWIGVAVIAGALMLLYLYRQIALGKIREEKVPEGDKVNSVG